MHVEFTGLYAYNLPTEGEKVLILDKWPTAGDINLRGAGDCASDLPAGEGVNVRYGECEWVGVAIDSLDRVPECSRGVGWWAIQLICNSGKLSPVVGESG